MKRFILYLLVAGTLIGGMASSWDLFAGPLPESEELEFPHATPPVVSRNAETVVTFAALLPDKRLNRPRLQFFDPDERRWRTINGFRDDGKHEDPVKHDRRFNLSVRFLDSDGKTNLSIPGRAWDTSSPVRLRLLAKKKGQKGAVVSPSIILESWSQIVNDDVKIALNVPPSMEETVYLNDLSLPLDPGASHIIFSMRSAAESDPAIDSPVDGCLFDVGVSENSASLPLDNWLLANTEKGPLDVDVDIEVAGILGVERTGVGEVFGDPFAVAYLPVGANVFDIVGEMHGDAPTIAECRAQFAKLLGSLKVVP